jgi:murein DD-endopeptidase MepM/ murein hydrolase activator NlpD
MKALTVILIVLAVVAGVSWYRAGKAAGPAIEIEKPARVIGQTGELALRIDTPGGKLNRLDVALEQRGKLLPIFSLVGGQASQLTHESAGRLRLTRSVGKRDLAELQAGPAQILVTATRPVLFGFREAQSTAAREIEVRLTPPTLAVVSSFHYINHGGSEMIVYSVSPADASSGVRVGEYEYRGFPASGAGVTHADADLRVAFFALLWDQDLKAPIKLFARDEVGNESSADFDYRVFPKKFRRSRIEIDDRFLTKVVPAILQASPQFTVENPSDLLASFLRINGELRRENNAQLTALADATAPQITWQGAFRQLTNTAVEGGFADQRTYFYKGKEVDHQVHLGFDLASTAAAPVVAANSGKVVHAAALGIYGNCVVLDHGMGLQSLYAHLSSIEVKVGDAVKQGDRLGRSGSTGLAAGDHLHFTTLLGGRAVTPIDWWSAKWVQDRITRKLREAEAVSQPTTSSR